MSASGIDGFESGPSATTAATARALARADRGRAIVLVEGISDQIAVETLARRMGRDLETEGVVVVPVGGAHAVARFLKLFEPGDSVRPVAGMCDAAEEEIFRSALSNMLPAPVQTREDMEAMGFFVCVEDLEDELVRAVGLAEVEALFVREGDGRAFRALQRQPEWRGKETASQMRRFLGAGSRRKLRYARALVDSVPPERAPRPLVAVLGSV